MPLQRQFPSAVPNAAQPQQHPQMNGVNPQNGPNMANGIQHAGQQADLNHLWSVVQELSEILATNRAQTASIINGVQRVQARAARDGTSPGVEQVNGELNGATTAQNAELYAENQALRTRNAFLENEIKESEELVTSYENAMQKVMEKLRPFAQAHEESRLSWMKHYNTLLQVERDVNLQLRMEHSTWQEGLGRAAYAARMALRLQSEEEEAKLRKLAAYRRENRVLRRLLDWDIETDSEDEEERKDEAERRRREDEEHEQRSRGPLQASGGAGPGPVQFENGVFR